jgi:hypothetical protein
MIDSFALLGLAVTSVTSVGTGYRKLSEFVANHVFRNKYWHMLATVVNRDRQANHIRQNHRPARPGLDRSAIVVFCRYCNLLREMYIDEWALSN